MGIEVKFGSSREVHNYLLQFYLQLYCILSSLAVHDYGFGVYFLVEAL